MPRSLPVILLQDDTGHIRAVFCRCQDNPKLFYYLSPESEEDATKLTEEGIQSECWSENLTRVKGHIVEDVNHASADPAESDSDSRGNTAGGKNTTTSRRIK